MSEGVEAGALREAGGVRESGLVAQADRWCEEGAYLDALGLIPALEADGGVAAMVAVSSIQWHLGARREADARTMRIWRRNRGSGRAQVEFVRTVLSLRGPYRAWKLFESLAEPTGDAPQVLGEWHSLKAYTLGALRDFEASRRLYQDALAADPGSAWTRVERSWVLQMEDRYEEAVEHAEAALALKPGYASATRVLAQLYSLTGRSGEAIALLAAAVGVTQSADLAILLFELQFERGLLEGARAALALCRERLPLADPELKQWMAARGCDLALRMGEVAAAVPLAREAGSEFYERLAQRLEGFSGAVPRRVELPVGFVRQHFNTCAPATLTAISRFWGMPAEHLEVAEAICYDGTPNHSERRWAEEQGFVVREFTVDWASARTLLDAGVPFTLTSVGTASAHLQAVVGYDELRGTLLIRDPFQPVHQEFEAQSFFRSHLAYGPRGMLLMPDAEAARISGVVLPEAAVWDGFHLVMGALSRNDREAAQAAAQAMEVNWPGHRLALGARRSLTAYDGNDAAVLAHTEQLLALFPDDANLKLAKAQVLASTAGRAECEAWWETVGEAAAADPAVAVAQARFLSADARRYRKVFNLLEGALNMQPSHALGWFTLAGLQWERGLREESLQYYRFAACLDTANEAFAETYFRAGYLLGRQEVALAFLRARVASLGSRSGAPAMTLHTQLDLLDRTAEAFEALETSLAARPADGALLLFAAEAYLRFNRTTEGERVLAQAGPFAKRSSWLRIHSILARDAGDVERALNLAREACEQEPLNVALNRLVVILLAQLRGNAEALRWLREVAGRHEHHFELQRLLLGWLGDDQDEVAIALVERLVELNPYDPWTHRELAVRRARAGDLARADASAREALRIAPDQADSHGTLAFVLLRAGRTAEARRRLKDALGCSVDNEYAQTTLLEIATTPESRHEALEWIRGELVRQNSLGDALLNFHASARLLMDADELLAMLIDTHCQRKDLWQVWVALGSQLTRMQRHEDAIALLTKAAELFPFLPRVHVELANSLRVHGRREESREVLVRALKVNPAYHAAVRMYADSVIDERSDLERALAVLEPAIRRMPENADLRALTGWTRWLMGQAEQAATDLQAALALDTGLGWAWDALGELARSTGRTELVLQTARELVRQRPGDSQAWLRLAELEGDTDHALEAIARGLGREPRHQGLHEMKLQLLLRARRFDELAAALDSSPWGPALPTALSVFRARAEHAQGRRDNAIAALRDLLARDESNFALWRELADWHDEGNQVAGYKEATQQMLRLAPNAAVSHAYAGHALLRASDEAGAEAALRRALELDPTYLFAGFNLFDLEFKAGETGKAQSTFDVLERQGPSAPLALRRMRLAAWRGDRDAAVAAAVSIAADSAAHPQLLEAAFNEVAYAGWTPWLVDGIEVQIAQGYCARHAVLLWIKHQGDGLLPGSFWRDMRRVLAKDQAHSLKRGYLQWAGEQVKAPGLNRFIRDHRLALLTDAECWALVGYVYVQHKRYEDCATWMANWRDRTGCPAWALDNLIVALRTLGRHREAHEATLRSAVLEPLNSEARVWLAVDGFLQDRPDELARQLGKVELSDTRLYFRHILSALRAWQEAAQANDSRLALPGLAALHGMREPVLRRLLRDIRSRLLARHTPAWLKPYRWLQLSLGWS